VCGPCRGANRNECVSPIDRQRTVVVRLAGARVGHSANRRGVHMRMLPGHVPMRIAIVDQLTMLGASRMLDQKHVAAARTLQKQSQQAREDASAPNH